MRSAIKESRALRGEGVKRQDRHSGSICSRRPDDGDKAEPDLETRKSRRCPDFAVGPANDFSEPLV